MVQLPGNDSTAAPIATLIVDMQPIVRAGLRFVLEKAGTSLVVGEAADGHSAIRLARQQTPDIVVLDSGLTRLDAYETTVRLRELPNPPKVLICYLQEDAFEAQQLVQAGATGFIPKDAEPEEFASAIQAVRAGGTYFPSALVSVLFSMQSSATKGFNVYGLTHRETEVLRFLADGFSNKEIARRLDLSVRTVETHRLNIRKKTRAGSLSDLIRIAKSLQISGQRTPALPEAGERKALNGASPSRNPERNQAATDCMRAENVEIV